MGEKGLAAGIACEAAILHAKSVELGELLAEHTARRTVHRCKTQTQVRDADIGVKSNKLHTQNGYRSGPPQVYVPQLCMPSDCETAVSQRKEQRLFFCATRATTIITRQACIRLKKLPDGSDVGFPVPIIAHSGNSRSVNCTATSRAQPFARSTSTQQLSHLSIPRLL